MKKYLEKQRYLASFDSRRLPHVFTDVLIVGSGVAGLRAAIEASRHAKVLVVTKGTLTQCNTMYAQGGIAAVLDRKDTRQSHIDDTLATGQGLSEMSAVETVVGEGPKRIRELAKWGAPFDRGLKGFHMTLEGGHSHPRVVHAKGDATGSAVEETLLAKVLRNNRIITRENTFVLDLMTVGARVVGVLASGPTGGKLMIWAEQIVLASGGLGRIFQETTNTEAATGDGVALAYRAGAVVRDMEFVQFHPTTLYLAGAPRLLISEAVRGEGAVLRNNRGEAFMPRYHEQADLAPRDAVSQSIVAEMKATGDTNVYLDMTGIPAKRRVERFPSITEQCMSFGLDPARDYIPVRPSAHYMVGGVKVDIDGCTNLTGLLAVGEAASSGLHGANRLASNSLLEGLVLGKRVGEYAGTHCKGKPVRRRPTDHTMPKPLGEEIDLDDVRRSLKALMWRNVGVERDARGLRQAVKRIDGWCRYVMVREFDSMEGWELQNMLTVSKIAAEGALARTESRGVHYRTDFPDRDDEHWQLHTEFVRPN